MKKMVSILICALALMVGHIQAQEVELTKEEKKALQEKIDSIPWLLSRRLWQAHTSLN